MSEFADVAVPVAVHGTFTYRIPDHLRAGVRVGSRVEVPLGTKRTTGFVVNFRDDAATDKLKPIHALLDEHEPALLPDIIDLCRWAAEYYLAPLGEMLRVALPANMSARAKPGEELRDAVGVRYDRFLVLSGPSTALGAGSAGEGPATPKQQAIIELLKKGEMLAKDLPASIVSTLARKGVVRIERRARKHALDAFIGGIAATDELKYSAEQHMAIDAIQASLGTFAPFVLEGVTGSGKTEVYIEVMREVVRRGGQGILLVPEISLTPVFAARLKERFGDRIAILHSSLSASERYDQWWRARRGEVDVAIGPRSALFTPFEKLGVIMVDEEGDGAYKQDETPRYNARDLAVVRAQLRKIPVVLGSATPSLESRENAARGKYTLLRMTHRVEARPLPEADVIDLRKERAEKEDRGFVIFSQPLKTAMQETFAAGEQAIVLINRRGYAPYLLCRECGNDFRCRDCSVTMTVHRNSGLLICHYCGARKTIPAKCTTCGGEVLQPIGFGTEKVEERFRRDFPGVAVDVLDRDSTRKKGSLVKILDRFRSGKTQALIGTQMLSKGHHFPNVTLTAVLSADSILGYPDFRSAEKTFYLLTQVAGRAGRGEKRGRVLIQTAFPTHYAIQHALRHDYEAFYESEIQFRRTFHYPPITSMIAILFRGVNVLDVERAASACGRSLEEAIAPLAGTRMQGPAPAPLARIKGVYRFQILLRSPHRVALRRAVEGVMGGRRWKGADVAIDVDPINIL
ncbi:MAG TPA: primosomal protein N' [Thermoanaerobaculia bacterium]|nr:primosomal protein N' [Thermoanaerobaculia bacterium]